MASNAKNGHFKGEKPIRHLAKKSADGIFSGEEIHGTELPGATAAFCDSGRETLFLCALAAPLLSFFHLISFFLAYSFWRGARGALLGWARLERLHRVVAQEKWEIEHNKEEEKEELAELYRAKGFSGQLLEDVVRTLSSDPERLLKVMVEEELCLKLSSEEHPLKQGFFAFLAPSLISSFILFAFFLFGYLGLYTASFFALFTIVFIVSKKSGNEIIPAIIWNASSFTLAILIFKLIQDVLTTFS